MTDAADLLAAIHAAPDDDGPRLIFADWLDDRGDADHAEFIRVQVELARMDEYHVDYPALYRSELELLRRSGHDWKIPLLRARQEFHRGFIESVWIRGDRLASESHRIEPHRLVRRLRVSGVDRQMEALFEIPWLDRLTELDLTNNSMIRFLIIDLFQAVSLHKLTSFILRNVRLWPEEFQLMLSSPVLANLLSLDLSGNPLGDEGIELLTGSPAFPTLRNLILRSDGVDETETIREAGFGRLANWPHLANLRRLDLTGHRPGNKGLQRFFESKNLTELHHLGISSKGDHSNDDWIQAFFQQPFPKLRSLALSGFFWSDMDWRILQEWSPLRRGGILDLRHLTIDAEQQADLERSPVAGQILFQDGDS